MARGTRDSSKFVAAAARDNAGGAGTREAKHPKVGDKTSNFLDLLILDIRYQSLLTST